MSMSYRTFFTFTEPTGEHDEIHIAYTHVVSIRTTVHSDGTILHFAKMTSGEIFEMSPDSFRCYLAQVSRNDKNGVPNAQPHDH